MNSTKLFWDYFEPMAQGVLPGTTILQSDGGQMETLMTASVSKKGFYPVVFVLRPAYKPFDNGAEQFYLWYQVTFYVFCQCKPGKSESVDAAYDQAEAIALRILKKLRKEHQTTEHVEFDYNSSALEPVTMMTLDSTAGYEVKIKLALPANDQLRNYLTDDDL